MKKYSTEKEVWKDIVGFEGFYQISNMGNVISYHKEEPRLLSPAPDKDGYLFTHIRGYKGKRKTLRIHRAVAEHFIDNPENKPQVNHINGNKADNRVQNLEWVTPSENMKHAIENGLWEWTPRKGGRKSVLTEEDINKIKTLRKKDSKTYTQVKLAGMFGVSRFSIYKALK